MVTPRYRLADDDIIYYLHIPKTGGTTFNAVLESHFEPGQIWPSHIDDPVARHRVGKNLAVELNRTPSEIVDRYRLVRGHYDYGIHEFLPRRPVYVTMLRNPVARTLSLYRHIRREPDHRMHDDLPANGSVRDLLEHPLAPGRFNDRQVHQVAGTVQQPRGELTDEALLALAQERLTKEFAYFGLTERFDESLELLTDTFGWPAVAHYESHNVTPRTTEISLSDADRAAIEGHNHLDMKLYHFATELFAVRFTRAVQPNIPQRDP